MLTHDQYLGLSQCYLLRKPKNGMEETQTDLGLNLDRASYKLGMLLSSLSPNYKMGRTTPNLEGPGKENSVSPVPGTGDGRVQGGPGDDRSQLCQRHLASRPPPGPELP